MDELIRLMRKVLPDGDRKALAFLKLYCILTFIFELMEGQKGKPGRGWQYSFGPLIANDMAGCEPELGPMGALQGKQRTRAWERDFSDLYDAFEQKRDGSCSIERFAQKELNTLFPYGRVQNALKAVEKKQVEASKGKERKASLWKGLEVLWICADLYTMEREKNKKVSQLFEERYPEKVRKNVDLTLVEAVWAALYCHPIRVERVKTMGATSEAFQLLEQAKLPLEDYPRFYTEAREAVRGSGDLNHLNHFICKVSNETKSTLIYEELQALYEAARKIARINPQSFYEYYDVIRGVPNDSGIEHGIVYDRYIKGSSRNHLFLLNPNIIIKKRLDKGKGLSDKLFTYCVQDEYMNAAFHTGFPVFQNMNSVIRRLYNPAVLVFAHKMESDKFLSLLETLHQAMLENEIQEATVLMQTSAFDNKKDGKLRAFLTEQFALQRMIWIGKGSPYGKELILELNTNREGHLFDTFEFVDTNYVSLNGNQQYLELEAPITIPYERLRDKGKTIQALAKQTASANQVRERQIAREYCFSPEISLWYTSTKLKSGKIRVEFSFYDYPTAKQVQRNQTSRGKLLARRDKNISAMDELAQTAEAMVFDPKMNPAIVEAVGRYLEGQPPITKPPQKRNQVNKRDTRKEKSKKTKQKGEELLERKSVSLKTFWVLVRSKLAEEAGKNGYNEELCMSAFNTWNEQARALSNLMIPDAGAEQFQSAVEAAATALELKEQETLELWEQVHLIVGQAVVKELYVLNPVDEFLPKNEPQKGKRRGHIRDGMVKRGFEPREEKDIFQWLMDQLPGHPAALGVLIRLFTGLSVGEAAGLCWGDIVRFVSERRQFRIYQQLRRGMQEPTLLQNAAKYRLVPIPIQLDRLLERQFQWLLEQTGLSEAELKEWPLLCHPGKPKAYLPVSALEKTARQAVEAANIPAHMVKIPGQDGKMTDLSRYGGDIFRENLRYRAASFCEMTEAELAYLFGRVLPDTYSKHY